MTNYSDLEHQLYAELMKAYEEAKEKHAYNPTRFVAMLNSKGAVQTVAELVSVNKVSEGLTKLWSEQALQLSLEAIALREPYNTLFSDSILAQARSKLHSLGYTGPELFEDQIQNEAKASALGDSQATRFYEWLVDIGKKERTANSYKGAIGGVISRWAISASFCKGNLLEVTSHSQMGHIKDQLLTYDEFLNANVKGNQMYSAALNAYIEFLASASDLQIAEDIQKIHDDEALEETQKQRLVSTRIGQGIFREGLINYWKGCAVTGYESTRLLVASHIKPWRECSNVDRLNKYNGLLLLPNLDKAFDLGYLSFSESGAILISNLLESPAMLGVHRDMKISVARQHDKFLTYHRENIFQ